MIHISLKTDKRLALMDITAAVQELVAKQKWQDGLIMVFSPHTTAALTINEGADLSVRRDIETTLARLVPLRGDYCHGEGNSDAHIKASLLSSSLLVPIENGDLVLGRWQAIFFCEFDGPRSRQINLKFIKAS